MTSSLDARDLVGAYELVSGWSQSLDGPNADFVGGARNDAPYGADPKGLLIYTESGRVLVHLSYAARAPLSINDRSAAPEHERAAAFTSAFSYAGRYELSGDTIIHHVDISTVPNWVGADQVRTIRVDGDRLWLTTPPRTLGGRTELFELEWRRAD